MPKEQFDFLNFQNKGEKEWQLIVYIYIDKQGQPAILNVDNDTDGTVLEQLGALKMPENLVTEIFGEQAEFADSTNCTITPNPDNPAFPFTVVFDASKIQAAPKRNISTLSGLAMPSEKYIDIPASFHVSSGTTWTKETTAWTAPVNGFISVTTGSDDNTDPTITAIHNVLILNSEDLPIYSEQTTLNNVYNMIISTCTPIKKGNKFQLIVKNNILVTATMRFYYMEGEL